MRKPAAYLVKRAYIRGIPFYVDERVIVPRSYIGELMFSGIFGGEAQPHRGRNAVDARARSLHRFRLPRHLAAGIFPNADIDAVDLSADALEVARINVDDHDLGQPDQPLARAIFSSRLKVATYDLIISNPPYVAAAEVAGLPARIRP